MRWWVAIVTLVAVVVVVVVVVVVAVVGCAVACVTESCALNVNNYTHKK